MNQEGRRQLARKPAPLNPERTDPEKWALGKRNQTLAEIGI
jgi:hypothetical protein